MKRLTLLFTILLGLTLLVQANPDDDAQKLYMQAKKLSFKQQWTEAVDILENLVQKYPESRFQDDARFWIGYCLERIPESKSEAYAAYQQLVQSFPNSPWVDDALVHQIDLAQNFIRSGQSQYIRFLEKQLSHDLPSVHQKAALALGSLGNSKAIPVLGEMAKASEHQELAQQYLVQLNPKLSLEQSNPVAKKATEVGSASLGDGVMIEEELPKTKGVFFDTHHYQTYRTMLKIAGKWQKNELIEFGLWHILPKKHFEAYFSLTTPYDRSEWRRKFWKAQDPTPTTPENEKQAAFEARVEFAHENYYEFWDNVHSPYLQDQHIRRGWAHAPWDARGEVYIKFGLPNHRTIQGFQSENWVYYNHDADLMIKKYMTNIFGNAISGTSIAGKMFGSFSDVERLEANFIFASTFEYQHDYKIKSIKNWEVEEDIDNAHSARFSYSVPLKEFRGKSKKSETAEYTQCVVILDEDMREIHREEIVKSAQNTKIEDKKFVETIDVPLPAGTYTFALRLDGKDTQKLGIFKWEFTLNDSVNVE